MATADENAELVRHWRRRARVAELAGTPLMVSLVDAADILNLEVDPPVVVLEPDGSFAVFGVEVVVAGAEGAPEA